MKQKRTELQKIIDKLRIKLFKIIDATKELEDELMTLYWLEKQKMQK